MTPPEFISPEMAIGLSMALPAVGALGVALIGRFVGENARDMWTSLITVLTFGFPSHGGEEDEEDSISPY